MTNPTQEQPGQLVTHILGTYVLCEGMAEDIGYAYLAPSPRPVVEALLGDRAWTSDQVERLLAAAIADKAITLGDADTGFRRIKAVFPQVRYEVHRQGERQGEYHLIAEWKWATKVRNDLAHSMVDPVAGHPGTYRLRTRSPRHRLHVLTGTFTVETLRELLQRFAVLLLVLQQVVRPQGSSAAK